MFNPEENTRFLAQNSIQGDTTTPAQQSPTSEDIVDRVVDSAFADEDPALKNEIAKSTMNVPLSNSQELQNYGPMENFMRTTVSSMVGSGLYLPDAAINSAIKLGRKAGIINENVPLDILDRMYRPETYAPIDPSDPSTFAGDEIGEYLQSKGDPLSTLNFPTTEKVPMTRQSGQIGEVTGDIAMLGIATAGTTAKFAQRRADDIAAGTRRLFRESKENGVKAAIADGLVLPYTKAPGRAAATEIGVSGLSGLGAGYGFWEGSQMPDYVGFDETTTKDTELLLGTAGSFAPMLAVTSPAKALYGITQWGVSKLPDTVKYYGRNLIENAPRLFTASGRESIKQEALEADKEVTENAVRKAINDMLSMVDEAYMVETNQRAEYIRSRAADAGGNPPPMTVAETYGGRAPEFVQAQSAMDVVKSPEALALEKERKYEALASIVAFGRSMFGADALSVSPSFVADKTKNTYTAVNRQLDDIDGEIESVTAQILGRLEPLSSEKKQTAGENLRSTVKDIRERMDFFLKGTATRMGINDDDVLVPAANMTEEMAALSATIFKQGGKDNQNPLWKYAPQALKDLTETTTPLDFVQWKMYKTLLEDELYMGSSANKLQAETALQKLDELAMRFYGDKNTQWQDYQKLYNLKGVMFNNSANAVMKRTKGNRFDGEDLLPVYHMEKEDIAESFLGSAGDVRNFMQMFGQKPERIEDLRLVVMDRIRNAWQANDGTLNNDKLRKHLFDNDQIYKELPFYDEITNTNALLKSVYDNNAVLNARRNAINDNGVLSAIAKYGQTNDAYKFLKESLGSPKSAKELREEMQRQANLTGDPSGFMKRWHASVTNTLIDNASLSRLFNGSYNQDEIPALTQSIGKMMIDNEPTLRAALGDEAFDDLGVMNDLFRFYFRKGIEFPMAGKEGLAEQGKLAKFGAWLGSSPAFLGTRLTAYKEQRIGAVSTALTIYFRALGASGTRAQQKLFAEAFSDPNLARELAKTPNKDLSTGKLPPIPEAKMKQLRAYLFNSGVDIFANYTSDPQVMPTREIEIDPVESIPEEEPMLYEVPEQRYFAEGGEVDSTDPINKESFNIEETYNPQLQMVPVASPAQQQQQPMQQPSQQTPPTDFGSLFPLDGIGGALADKKQPTQPAQPAPPPMQQGIGGLR